MKKLVLPKHLQGHQNYPKREVVWKQNEVIPLSYEMVKQGFAPTKWQVQYQFPNATCDLYWVSFHCDARRPDQDWDNFVEECPLILLAHLKNGLNTKILSRKSWTLVM